MFDWLIQQDSADLAVFGTGIGTVLGAVVLAVRGIMKGKPTPAAVVTAIESIPACRAVEAANGICDQLNDQRDLLQRMNDTLIRLEDRTRRD